MAELDAQLRLDIDQALRDINQIETALDRALGSVELRLDSTSARRQLDDLAQIADQALGDVDIDFDAGAASRLNSELAGVERNLEGADREADQLAGSLRGAARAANETNASAGGLSRAFGGMGKALANVSIAAAALVAIRGAFNFAIDAKDAFATLQDSANAVKVVFGDAVGTIEAFGESVAQSAGLSTAEFNQSASVLGSALLNVGFSADIAATKTVELTQRAADMASIFGGPVGDALGAIQSALRGETDPIERFGVSLSEAAVNAQAAALGFQTVAGEFSTSEKAAARLDLIMAQTARTSGDFANTSGDLANAQKVLAAEFENAKASLGEALLPIFQSLLDIGPEVIASIEQLAPSFQAFAISLGNLLEHREGAADLLDVLEGLADIPRAFGALGTIFTAISDAEGASQRFTEQINTQGLINDLRKGTDAASALANRLAQVGREGKLSPAFIRDLTKIAGTDVRETAASLTELVKRGQELGLADDEIRNVAVALAQLNSVGESSEAERAFDRARIAAGELAVASGPAVSALEGIQIAASEAGVGLDEFVSSADPVAQALLLALDPADRAAVLMGTVGTAAGTAAGIFDTVFRPAIADASQALEDLGTDGRVSADEFITNLQRMTAAQLLFATNLATIFALDPDVAAQLATLPLEAAQDIVTQAAGDPAKVQELVEAFFGTSQQQQDALLSIFNDTFTGLVSADPVLQAKAAEFLEAQFKDAPGLKQRLEAAMKGAIQPALFASFAALEPADATPVVRRTFEDMNQAELSAALSDKLGASFADLDLPTITPAMLRPIRGLDSAAIARAVETALSGPINTALNASFADVELTEFTPIVTDSVERTNTAAVTADMNTAMGVSFADIELPPFTPMFTAAIGKISGKEVTAALDAALGVSFADLDLSDEGAEARATFMSGLSTPRSGETGRLRQSILQTVNGAIQRQSPPKLFLDAGIESADAFWMGFEQTEGKVSSAGMLAALDAAMGASFADVEVPDFTPVISRGIQGVNIAQTQTELEAALAASFADVELPGFTPLVVASVEGTNTAVVTDEMQAALAASFADLELPTVTPTVGRISAAELDAALNVSFADVEAPEFIPAVGEVSTADMEAALAASFADVEVPEFIPTVGKISTKEVSAAFDAAMAVSFADVTAPEFTSTVVASVEGTDTAAVTASLDAAMAVSFADVTLPDPTAQVVEAFGKLSSQEITAAFDPALRASFADVDLSNEGVEARGTFMSGLSTPTSGETGRLRQSILQTVNGAIQRQSPPKLFLDAGIDSGEAFWLGFGESDFIRPDWLQHLGGQFPAIAEAAAGSFRTSFEQLEGELPAVIQRSAEAVDLTHFDDLGAAIGRQLTTAIEGDFRLSPELDPLTAEQLLALNLDPITPVIGPADPLTVGQLQEMVDAANAARTVVESQLEAIQFDFELQGLQEERAALIAITGELGTAAREAFMVGLSASTSEEVVQLRASILDAINSATESSSPSRLMLRLGEAAGEAYWSGFAQSDLSLRVPVPQMTGKISTSTVAVAAGGEAGFTFAPTYVNTETRDLETVVARSEQLMGAVSGILNGRFKL